MSEATRDFFLPGPNCTTARAAPDVPRHEPTSTRSNPRVEDTFDNTHPTEASRTKALTTCAGFTYTERDPFRRREEKNPAD